MAFPADHGPTADLGGLAATTEPAWLWQPGTGALLWGNAAALALWKAGSLAELQSLKVDRAMPALTQLQRLQWALGADISHHETLMVWLPDGIRRLECLCRKVAFAGNDGAILVTVTGPQHKTQLSPAGAARHLNGHGGGVPVVLTHRQPDIAPEDAATLAEIARMIRERSATAAAATEPIIETTSADTVMGPALDAAFLARLSHELRTPLNAIMGYAELLRAERDGPLGSIKYHAFAGHILESAAHCLNLANDLDDPSGRSVGVRPQEFSEVDVNETVQVCLGIMMPIADKAGVSLIASADAAAPRAVLDRRSLRQILLNLIANSIKATAPGGSITVSTAYRPGQGLTVTVADTGGGMSPEHLARARSDNPPGDGLGLPLSRKLADANGAKLTIESSPGEGTRVSLQLPMGRLVT